MSGWYNRSKVSKKKVKQIGHRSDLIIPHAAQAVLSWPCGQFTLKWALRNSFERNGMIFSIMYEFYLYIGGE